MFNLPAVMADENEDIQYREIQGGNNKKIHSPNAISVVMKKGFPRLNLFSACGLGRLWDMFCNYIEGGSIRNTNMLNLVNGDYIISNACKQ
ncbi:hypothetical protein [Desulfosporosinus fructosivorans]